MADKPHKEPTEADRLEETKRIMERLTRMPHKPHEPLKKRPAGKGRVRKGKSRS